MNALFSSMQPERTTRALRPVDFINPQKREYWAVIADPDEEEDPNVEIDEENQAEHLLNLHAIIQRKSQNFGEIFKKHYLNNLQNRGKMMTKKPENPLQAGQVVHLVDETTESGAWRNGVVHSVKTDKDGIARSALGRITPRRFLNRPAKCLAI